MRVGPKQRKQLRTNAAIAAKPFSAWEASLKAQQRRDYVATIRGVDCK
jgi:hypothetical protein